VRASRHFFQGGVLVALSAGSVLLDAPPARAADPPPDTVRLDYKRDVGASPSCPDEQEFRDAMAAHVHRPLFEPQAPGRLVVRLQGRNNWYHGAAELRDAAGVPAWTVALGPIPRDCAAIVENLALSIAIKVDPRGTQRAAPVLVQNPHRVFGVDGEVLPMPPPEENKPVPPDPRRDTAVMVAGPAEEPELRVRLGMAGGVAIATGPGWSPSFAVDAGVRWRDRPLSLAFEASIIPPSSGDLMSSGHLVHVTTFRLTGAGVACGHFVRYLIACGVAEVGALHATATAMDLAAHPSTLFYAGAGGRAGVELPIHPRVAVRVSGDALLTISRPVFEAGGVPVYEGSLVTGTAGGGLIFNF
jgi:hypothetical protein